MLPKLPFYTLCLVLVLQLYFLNPTIPVVNQSFGDTVERVEKRYSVAFPRVSQEAMYVSSRNSNYQQIRFVGDVMLARNVEYLLVKNGQDYIFNDSQLFSRDFGTAVVGNFEAAIQSEHTMTPAYVMKFSVNEEYAPLLSNYGFTHMSLANNHSYDFGQEAFVRTKNVLEGASIDAFGSQADLSESTTFIKTPKGVIALVGLNVTSGQFSSVELAEKVTAAAATSDAQIIYIHWGIEYATTHSASQSVLAEQLVSAGADLIIGHHPHVVQDIEVIQGVPVLYSLGNFIFDQYFSPSVQEGLVVDLLVSDTPTLFLRGVSSKQYLSQSRLLNSEQQSIFLKSLASKSDPSISEEVKAGIIKLPNLFATSPKMAMMEK